MISFPARFLRASLAFLVFVLTASGADAQSGPPILVTESGQLIPVKVFVDAGDFDAARQQARAVTAGAPNQDLWIRLTEGLILVRQGRGDEASRAFRAILSEDPEFEPARLELTSVLARSGQREAAIYHAQRLAATTENERLRRDLDALLEASRGQPWGLSFRFSVEPSTNVNRGSSQETITIGDGGDLVIENQAEGGVAVRLGATGFRRWILDENMALTLSGGINRKQVLSGDAANETTVTARLPLSRRLERGRLSFGPLYERTYSDGELYRERIGLETGLSISPRRGRTWFANASWANQNYAELDYLDGERTQFRLGHSRQQNAALTWGIDSSLLRETSRRDHLDHTDIGLGAFIERDWRSGYITSLRADLVSKNYDGIFPGKSFARYDTEARMRVSVRNRGWQIGRITPEFSYTYTNSSSNVEFYDYDSHDLGVAFTSRF